MKEFKIAWGNIKRRKSSSITLAIMSALAVVMLIISLSLLTGVGSLVETRIQALNAGDITFAINANFWTDELTYIVENADGKIEHETKHAMLGEAFIQDSTEHNAIFMFTHLPQNPNLNTVYVLNQLSTTPQNPIILPLVYRTRGFRAGEDFVVNSLGFSQSFIIYGFFETILFSAPAMHKAFINPAAFDIIEQDYSFFSVYTTSMTFETTAQSQDFLFGIILTDFEGILLHASNIGGMRINMTSFPMIMAALLSLVALIVVVISLIVARFNIINSLEQDMKTVGALKGIGYSSKQLIGATILQYLLIVSVGAILGLILAFPLMIGVGNIVASTTGLLWAGISMALPAIISVIAVVGTMTLATYLIARRTKKITPIVALRSGIETHSFKKSATNLQQTKMPLNIAMSIKMFKGNFRRNIAVFITLTLFGFMATLGFAAHYNFVVDSSAYRAMMGLEPAHVRVVAFSDEIATNNFGTIADRQNVRATLEFDFAWGYLEEGQGLRFMVFDDVADREVTALISGRLPVADNEIIITAATSNWIGYRIGDSLEMQHSNGNSSTFLITGLTQGSGANGFMNRAALERMQENAVFRHLYIYLYDSSDEAIVEFMNGLVQDFGRDMAIINYVEQFEGFLRTLEQPINIAMIFIMLITIFVIVLVLFLMVNTIINRHKKEAGMLKAVGFTSRQLILQMLLSFVPVILAGVILGVVLGLVATNPLLGLMFSGLGVAQAAFIIVPALAIFGALIIAATSVVTILLVSLKYNRITAKELIAEG